MKNKKRNLIIGLFILVIVGISLLFIFQKDATKLTTEEKKWISDNETKVQNISVINDTNIFGKLGEGIYYSFLEDLAAEYNIKLNPITMTKNDTINSISFSVKNNLPENAFPFYEDHYVLVGKNKELITSLEKLENKKIGVLNSNVEYIKKYLKKITFIEYEKEEDLISSLDNGETNGIIVPRIEYIDTILEKNYTMNYHFSELKRIYLLEDSSNTTLFSIMKKYATKWSKKSLEQSMFENERKLFQKSLKILDTSLAELQRKEITYAFVTHTPYEVIADRQIGGIFGEYLNIFAKFADVDMNYKKYNNEKKMIKDFNNNKIMLYGNYSTIMNNGSIIDTMIPIKYEVFVHESNPIVIETIESLKGKTIYVEKNTLLAQNLSTIEGLKIEYYESSKINEILKKNNIIVIDKNVGEYLKRTSLKKFVSRYTGVLENSYSFRSLGNETLNTLFAKYINYLDGNTMENKGFYSGIETANKGSVLNSIATYVLCAVIIIAIILVLIYHSSKKVRMQKKVKKEDRMKFIDQLTSLKNRNYLTENLPNWNKNTIYPQSVIVIDLNKVQLINDTLGYEEGDRQIKAAANSLIKTQLDNTDIIRTDGNEFVIYLIGYNPKQITSYIHKLNKEFKSLPFSEYGVTISYSMIEDDLKSIEDALNECVEDIKKQKENKKEEEK